MKSELDYYLDEPVLPRISDFDVLGGGKQMGLSIQLYKRLFEISMPFRYLQLHLSWLFCTSGKMVSKHRSRLHPHTLEALMCTQSWLGGEMKGT